MSQSAYSLDERRRDVVLSALVERCAERGWILIAAHVRTTHVHVVIAGEIPPERIMNDLKAYASRILNRTEIDPPDRKRWARHGSTRWLWDRKNVSAAITYVAEKQGDPMALFVATDYEI
jgi:REP element-mobilizing transposase RayT